MDCADYREMNNQRKKRVNDRVSYGGRGRGKEGEREKKREKRERKRGVSVFRKHAAEYLGKRDVAVSSNHQTNMIVCVCVGTFV